MHANVVGMPLSRHKIITVCNKMICMCLAAHPIPMVVDSSLSTKVLTPPTTVFTGPRSQPASVRLAAGVVHLEVCLLVLLTMHVPGV